MTAMACEHWDLDADVKCSAWAVVLVVASDDSDTWRGGLCEEHLMEYQADTDLEVTIVRDWRS
jgi:hypothetical protein